MTKDNNRHKIQRGTITRGATIPRMQPVKPKPTPPQPPDPEGPEPDKEAGTTDR